jgi:sensor histidine kinase regulating citrate/malate metabolism
LLNLLSGLIVLSIIISLFYLSLKDNTEKQIAVQARSVANLASSRVDVVLAYSSPEPSSSLRGIAAEIVRKTNAAFVVFLDNNGIRYSHPNPELIGKPFTGNDELPALREGRSYISKAIGISGPSIRAFAPVYDYSGRQLGAVAVGFWEPDISNIIWGVFRILYIIIPVTLISVALFSFLLASNVKRTLFGMEPAEIATQLKERETMLESVREGVVAIDTDCRVTVANSAARRILGPEKNIIGNDVKKIIPNTRLPIVMESRKAELDEPMLVNDHVVLVNRIPLVVNNQTVGAISTFRDMTEINSLAEELTGARQHVDTLRARSHEFMNKLQAISGLIQLGAYAEARSFITRLTAKEQSFIEFLIKNIASPAAAGLLEGKSAEAQERGIALTIDPQSRLVALPTYFDENALIIVLGNLIENAMDAVQDQPPGRRQVNVLLAQDDEEILIAVSDNGGGIPEDLLTRIFTKGFSTKELGRGYGLANVKSRVDLASGHIDIASGDAGTTVTIRIPIGQAV